MNRVGGVISTVNKFLESKGKTITKFLVIIFAALICSVLVITLADDSTAAPPISFTDNGIIYTVTSEDAFDTFDGTVKVGINGGTVGPVTIPSEVTNNLDLKTYSVTSIDDAAFSNCSGLTSIDIHNSVTSIGHSSFYSCSVLKSVILTDGVLSIGGYAFANCSSLTSFTIPNSVTSVDRGVFATCNNLASVTIPEGVTSIDDYAFFDCSGISYIIIPASVTFIGENAFQGFEFYLNNGTDKIVTNDAESLAGHTYSGSGWQDLVQDVTHTVSFKSGEDSIQSYQLIIGSKIVLPDETITKESTDQYDYTFVKWEGYEEGMEVTGDVTFTAVFNEIAKPQDTTTSDNNTMLYVGIAIVIIVIISLIAIVMIRSKNKS